MLEQLQDLIPIEYLIVAAIVLAVLFVITLAFRALAGRSSASESSRLGISESLEIDKQRRLVLVRRDDVEHLVLLGSDQDLVVESAIRPGVQRREDAPASPRIMPGDRLEPAREHTPGAARARVTARPVPIRPARPAVFGDHAPAPPPAPPPRPQERAEPRLEALDSDDKSREA